MAAACSNGPTDGARAGTDGLPDTVVARVGSEPIAAVTVERLAAARGLEPEAALAALVQDALLATGARERIAEAGWVSAIERASLARALLESLSRASEAQGVPTDLELGELRREGWETYDRPESVRTAHAVVLVKEEGDRAKALESARELLQAVEGQTEQLPFLEAAAGMAAAIKERGFELRAERLPPVTADGRLVLKDEPAFERRGAEKLEAAYAEAAHRIETVGAQSGIVETRYGFHVILSVERIAESTYSVDELRVVGAQDVYDKRSRAELEKLLAKLVAQAAPSPSRAAKELTAQVRVAP
jgi:hypothetical protein